MIRNRDVYTSWIQRNTSSLTQVQISQQFLMSSTKHWKISLFKSLQNAPRTESLGVKYNNSQCGVLEWFHNSPHSDEQEWLKYNIPNLDRLEWLQYNKPHHGVRGDNSWGFPPNLWLTTFFLRDILHLTLKMILK